MKETDVKTFEQCSYCNKGLNTTHCSSYMQIWKNDKSFSCPYFSFDDYKFDEDYRVK